MPALAGALRGLMGGTPPPSGPAIAADAERWEGQGYVYGGQASSPGDWDCSSFVSWVLGRDLGMRLPGGGTYGDTGYPPNSHGPVVTDYAAWTGARTVPGPPAPGDLCCFVGSGASGHIGIAVSATEMVSALDSQQGTLRTPIVGYGPPGAPLVYRRVLGVAGPVPPGPAPGPGGGGGGTGLGRAIGAGLVAAGLAVATIGLAGLIGFGLAAGMIWVMAQARPQ